MHSPHKTARSCAPKSSGNLPETSWDHACLSSICKVVVGGSSKLDKFLVTAVDFSLFSDLSRERHIYLSLYFSRRLVDLTMSDSIHIESCRGCLLRFRLHESEFQWASALTYRIIYSIFDGEACPKDVCCVFVFARAKFSKHQHFLHGFFGYDRDCQRASIKRWTRLIENIFSKASHRDS